MDPNGVSNGEINPDHLFVNYATEDGDFAEWLTLRLTVEGYKVWCDRVRLLGGESYPRDIDTAIKTASFRMLSIISKSSLNKHNPLKERTLGHNISRQRNIDFVIPLVIDDTRPDELDWMDADLTYISFRDSWAMGLLQLCNKLRSIDAPAHLVNGSKLVGNWITSQSGLSGNPERLWSNLFQISHLVPTVYRMITPSNDSISPDNPGIYFRQSDDVLWTFSLPESHTIFTQHAWNSPDRGQLGLSPLEATTRLLGKHIETLLMRRGAKTTPDGLLYLGGDGTKVSWLYYKGTDGTRAHLSATGLRTVRARDGSRSQYRYYLSPVFTPILRRYRTPVLQLNVRLHLSDLQGTPLDATITNRRRKRITKDWWNREWFSRVLAVSQWAFDGESECNISLGCGYDIIVGGFPIAMMAPEGIDECSLPEESTITNFSGKDVYGGGIPVAEDMDDADLEDDDYPVNEVDELNME